MALLRMTPKSGSPAASLREINGAAVQVNALFRSAEVKNAALENLSDVWNIAIESRVGELTAAAKELATQPSDVLLIDLDPDDKDQLRALMGLVSREGATPVVVTAANPSVDGMRQLMRLGIREVVPQPLNRKDLVTAIESAVRQARRGGEPGKLGTLVCFLKSGGGVGCTTIATQGACALALERARINKKLLKKQKSGVEQRPSILLIDFDIQFGAVALQLDLDATASVQDLIEKVDRLDGAMLRSTVHSHSSGLDVLVAPASVQPLDAVSPKAALRLIEVARQEYEHVIVDLPSAWTAWTRALLERSSGIVMVLRPTVPSIRQARRQLDVLVEEQLAHVPLVVVANQVERGWFVSRIPLKEIARAVGHPVNAEISANPAAMIEAGNTGLLLSDVSKGKRSWREIGSLLTRVTEMAHAADRPIAALGS